MEENKKDIELEEKVDNTEENNIEENNVKVENTEVKSEEETKEVVEVDEHSAMKEQLKAEITEELKAHIDSDEKIKDKKADTVVETGFFGNLAISFVDLIASTAIAFVLYMLTKVILKAIGYNIVDTFGIYLIVYVITNLLYRPVLKALKMHETVGEKVLNIK